ncbi:hypothetical protein SUGI_0303100 [Cryptomeria japonica]|nr:hypothetical protein SUGI_0303100 [Cryptomeria japonica]
MQLVIGEHQEIQTAASGESGRNGSLQLIVVEQEYLQMGKLGELRWNGRSEGIDKLRARTEWKEGSQEQLLLLKGIERVRKSGD